MPGLWSYKSTFAENSNREEVSESNIGYPLGAGYGFRMTRNLGLFAGLHLLTGNVSVENERKPVANPLRHGPGHTAIKRLTHIFHR